MGLQVELREDIIAELHDPDPLLTGANVEFLNNLAHKVSDISDAFRLDGIRAVNQEDNVGGITFNHCRQKKKWSSVPVHSRSAFLTTSASGACICHTQCDPH